MTASDEKRIDPSHQSTRTFLRGFGPLLLVAGLCTLGYGATRMFGFFDDDPPARRQGPKMGEPGWFEHESAEMDREHGRAGRSILTGFGIVAAGMLMAAVGGAMTTWGYMGRVARYAAGELAPVGKDTFNYMAGGTRDGVRTVATAVGEGLGLRRPAGSASGDSTSTAGPACPSCGAANDADAKFCDECGRPLHRACDQCSAVNDADAKFCDECGNRLSD